MQEKLAKQKALINQISALPGYSLYSDVICNVPMIPSLPPAMWGDEFVDDQLYSDAPSSFAILVFRDLPPVVEADIVSWLLSASGASVKHLDATPPPGKLLGLQLCGNCDAMREVFGTELGRFIISVLHDELGPSMQEILRPSRHSNANLICESAQKCENACARVAVLAVCQWDM